MYELLIRDHDSTLDFHHVLNCPHRHCCFPDHVIPELTKTEHWEKHRKTHCPQGHEFTPENTLYSNGGRRCRECCRVKSLEYRNAHREQENKTSLAWYYKNREKVLAREREKRQRAKQSEGT